MHSLCSPEEKLLFVSDSSAPCCSYTASVLRFALFVLFRVIIVMALVFVAPCWDLWETCPAIARVSFPIKQSSRHSIPKKSDGSFEGYACFMT